jgi:hypothetical protein
MNRPKGQGRQLLWAGCLVALLPSGLFAAETTVYRCTRADGSVVFSDRPCDGEMKRQVIRSADPGAGGERAREGIKRLAREYEERKAAERAADERRRAAEAARQQAPVVVVQPPAGGTVGSRYPYTGYPGTLYDRYRDPGGGFYADEDGFSFWYGDRPPRHRDHRHPHPPHKRGERPDPYSVTGEPIKEPGYSGRYPGGFPGYR